MIYLKKTGIFLVLLNCILASAINVSCQTSVKETINGKVSTYTNPLGGITNIGDPYILKYGEKYYMYATSSNKGFKVWESNNLIDWQMKGLALDKDNPGNNWGINSFWAPEVKYYNGKFYMTYSARIPNDRMKIRIAVSDSPLGPFINWSEPFMGKDDLSYIDADLLIDGKKVYMYFSKDCSYNIVDGKHTSQIWVAELNEDLKTMATEPVLATTPVQNWENPNNAWRWNEGPCVVKFGNTYYLMFSANVYDNADYSIGLATAKNPLGPWTKYEGNPILKKDLSIGVSGPGHNSVTVSPDGKEWFIVYHTHTFADKPSGNRNLCIDRMVFENGTIRVIGPTRTPQPLPAGVKYRLVPKP
ncbi:MAG: glycoside hydrolase family 43 protein [Bacteroidota bacterium]|nr:glycoside hydrolase family 43 protein [Bacteroidota bacterium]